MERFRFRQHQSDELSHYASDCWDAESQVEGDWIEITGFAYRGCYDLKKHDQYSREDYKIFKEYEEPRTMSEIVVDVDDSYLGPEFGSMAPKIKDKIIDKVSLEKESAFDGGKVEIEIEGETYSISNEYIDYEETKKVKNGEHILPHVVEPSFGIDRIVYTVLAHSYDEDEVDDEERTVMRFNETVAPTEVAVFPLMDKDGLSEKAREVADMLREEGFSVKYDDTGNIGKRYRRQDEVGTPICVTVDYDTLENDPETVTVRDRDSTEQERVKIGKLGNFIRNEF
jgi:glycyl-tRNA synthetase